jgi:hypothetical protein
MLVLVPAGRHGGQAGTYRPPGPTVVCLGLLSQAKNIQPLSLVLYHNLTKAVGPVRT